MMMTIVACRDVGLRFAGVHDPFWIHVWDVDQMNMILGEKFVQSVLNVSHMEDEGKSQRKTAVYEALNEVVRCLKNETVFMVLQIDPSNRRESESFSLLAAIINKYKGAMIGSVPHWFKVAFQYTMENNLGRF